MRRCATIIALAVCCGATAGCKPRNISVTETPIKVSHETEGYGDAVRSGDVVRVDYEITLPDGRTVLRQQDFRFQIGTDSVIRGVDEAIVGMKTGGTRRFTCPPHKHWGRAGYANGLIPPATDLTISLRLRSIEGRSHRRVVSSGD